MGALVRPVAARAALALALAGVVVAPFPSVRAADSTDAAQSPAPRVAPVSRAASAATPQVTDTLTAEQPQPLRQHFDDPQAVLSFDPPTGWLRTPATSLNPVSDPPEPVFEVARYQVRIGDPSIYASPVPITSGLVEDAIAVISVGVARTGSELIGMDLRVRGENVASAPGFVTFDEDVTYEGVRIFTRYFLSRETDRVVVFRAAAADAEWASMQTAILAAASSLRADPRGANAPAAPPPPPPQPPQVVAPAPDPTAQIRSSILTRAATLLGLQYVWGGNSTARGMDCSAFVSWTWQVDRYTTDSIWEVSSPIAKSQLRPGDALNLTIGRDPRRFGHIRLFEAWANAEQSLLWVFEETPPRAVHRVIAYDDRYQPIRLDGLSSAGETKLIPGLLAPERTFQPLPTYRPYFGPTPRPTPRPTVRVTPRPSPTPTLRPGTTARPAGMPTNRPSSPPTRNPDERP